MLKEFEAAASKIANAEAKVPFGRCKLHPSSHQLGRAGVRRKGVKERGDKIPRRSISLHPAGEQGDDDQSGSEYNGNRRNMTESRDENENGGSLGMNVNGKGNSDGNGNKNLDTDKNESSATNRGKELKKKSIDFSGTRRDKNNNSRPVETEATTTERDEENKGNAAKKTESKDHRLWCRKPKEQIICIEQENSNREHGERRRGKKEHRNRCGKSKKEEVSDVDSEAGGGTEKGVRKGGSVGGKALGSCYCCEPKTSTSTRLTTCRNCMPHLPCW